MASQAPQILFNITLLDYKQNYGSSRQQRSGQYSHNNCMASDFCNTLLQDLVDDIDNIDGIAVNYIGYKPSPSRSRGGDQRRSEYRPLPDKPEIYAVCGDEYTLNIEHHNKLCLLIGILEEYLPTGKILGTSLNLDVSVLHIIYVGFMLFSIFGSSVKDGVVNRVMHSLERRYNEVSIITMYSCLQAPSPSEGTLTLKGGVSRMYHYFNQP